ncbi:toll-like receptor 4, partial [Asbolus verrucosus]
IEIECPSQCKCDIFEKLKRATCTNRKLAGIESNLPQQTELLDLSYNQISHLDKHVFIIHMKAFEGLNKLKSLDLSYNAIQYILKNWLRNLKSLEELYLRGNSFSKFDDEPLFNSKTLKKLDLSNCRIAYLGQALSDLPNLEILDISGNYLINLNVATVAPLKNLNILNAKNNTFSCDEKLRNLTNYCVQNGIRFQDPCQRNVSESEKFQRIMNMVEPQDEKNSWIYDEEENVKNITATTEKCNDTRTDKNLLQEIVDLSPALSLLIPFIYGIAVGILIGCVVQIKSKKKTNSTESTYISFDDGDTHFRRRRNRFSRAFSSEDHQSLPLKEWKLSESTPVLFRKNQVNL